MKKIILLTILIVGSSMHLIAQCTPDTTYTKPGIYPKNLPYAKEDSTYSETIQFKMPKDTNSILGLVKFDSIAIFAISNIPKGLTYQCNPVQGFSACTFPGGSNGCLTISGKPDSNTYGKYFCVATLRAFVVIGGNATYFDSKDTLIFFVQSKNGNLGISQHSLKSNIQVYPIPMTEQLNVSMESLMTGPAVASIYSSTGQEMLSEKIVLSKGQNQFHLETQNLAKGYYILKVNSGNGELIRSLIK